ncbi:MAG: hypothetical protein F6J87_04955 [Spirulina sp. SIO3F2]|nr:hypothetical protein [Spirulina sp. SIO3F2]
MATPFDPVTVEALASRIDQEIAALGKVAPMAVQRSLDEPDAPLAKQVAEIQRVTGESARGFLRKFRRAAKADICEEGGVLSAQWQQWQDLASGDVVKSFGPILVAMGFSGALLDTVLVAVAVIVIHLGLKTFCEEFSE